jgi:methionyl-tRNA formyltransferase
VSVLFLGKKGDYYCERALDFVLANLPDSTVLMGQRGDPYIDIQKKFEGWAGHYIISYLSPWIVPKYLLDRARIASINFHPGPPEYPGIGCTNFAIYNNEPFYGVTCHHMDLKVDIGKIIAVRRFPLFKTDAVFSLTQRCYSYLLTLFYDIFSLIVENKTLPSSSELWKRKPYTRAELNDLCRIKPEMSNDEISRRIRATTFPGKPGAFIEINGVKFAYTSNESCS